MALLGLKRSDQWNYRQMISQLNPIPIIDSIRQYLGIEDLNFNLQIMQSGRVNFDSQIIQNNKFDFGKLSKFINSIRVYGTDQNFLYDKQQNLIGRRIKLNLMLYTKYSQLSIFLCNCSYDIINEKWTIDYGYNN